MEPQMGAVALTFSRSIVRIPDAQINPQLESDCVGIPGSVTYSTKGKACKDLLGSNAHPETPDDLQKHAEESEARSC
ncbi:hypothetical protein EYF80_034654 [Liparis tanakae]|uniref:Uncharacterized protein n=1 Tax=Liparis tanakae TaxID=230148 RepID=A0A4Z2GPH4_9TELE|nr:hypothetical protein EYF80_034654 [Liparis tanakae]